MQTNPFFDLPNIIKNQLTEVLFRAGLIKASEDPVIEKINENFFCFTTNYYLTRENLDILLEQKSPSFLKLEPENNTLKIYFTFKHAKYYSLLDLI